MSVFAAYDTLRIKLADLGKDHEQEIQRLVEEMRSMNPKRLEEDVFKELSFDLCRPCHRQFIGDPLGRERGRSEAPASLPPFDVDEFLRRIRDS